MPTTDLPRRSLLAAATGTLAAPLAAPGLARAQAAPWPNRPVRIVNPYGPGGTADIMIRPLTERLERVFGRPFIVENRPGAGGTIGTGAAAAERPDGHTLLVSNLGPLAVGPAVFRNLAYDPARSFSWIAMLGGAPLLCAVKAGGPVRSMADYAAAAKAAPEAMSFGSSGIASAGHLAGALFGAEVGANLLHIPFRSAAEAQQSLLGGNVASLWDTLSPQAEAVRSGLLTGLAVTSAERVAAVPDVPTVAELGLPAVTATNWFLLAGPAGLDPAIVRRLHDTVAETFAEPAARQRLSLAGIVPLGDPDPAGIDRFVAEERDRWSRVVRQASITAG